MNNQRREFLFGHLVSLPSRISSSGFQRIVPVVAPARTATRGFALRRYASQPSSSRARL